MPRIFYYALFLTIGFNNNKYNILINKDLIIKFIMSDIIIFVVLNINIEIEINAIYIAITVIKEKTLIIVLWL